MRESDRKSKVCMTSPVHELSTGLELTEPKQKLPVVKGRAWGRKTGEGGRRCKLPGVKHIVLGRDVQHGDCHQ